MEVAPRSRSRAMLLLAVVVASVIGVSWLATGGISRLLTSPKPTAKPFVESLPSLVSQGCSPTEFELSGAFNDCARVSRYESAAVQAWFKGPGGRPLLPGGITCFLF